MDQNVGKLDAWIRGGLAIVFLTIAAVYHHRPLVSLASAFVALMLAGTALTRRCPMYRVTKVDTYRRLKPSS